MPGVVDFPSSPKPTHLSDHESWLRRQAIQIAAQLPENPEDALIVLSLAEGLQRSFLSGIKPA